MKMKKRKGIWCSRHKPLKEQLEELEREYELDYLEEKSPSLLNQLSNTPASEDMLSILAGTFIYFVIMEEYDAIIQPAGSPAFQFILGTKLEQRDLYKLRVLYAHSERESVEEEIEGEVRKVSVFRHVKFLDL